MIERVPYYGWLQPTLTNAERDVCGKSRRCSVKIPDRKEKAIREAIRKGWWEAEKEIERLLFSRGLNKRDIPREIYCVMELSARKAEEEILDAICRDGRTLK